MRTKKNTPKKATTTVKAAGSGNPMDAGLLEQIVKLMAANDLNTVDVRDGQKRVVIKRGPAAVALPMTMPTLAAPAPVAIPAASAPSAAKPAEKPSEDANFLAIKSPMVGTFYSSPSPDAKPFVSVGSTIGDDSDVCIIEAMKVFNNIKAECKGTIAKILVSNGQTVEFGQTLFLVKP